MLDGASWETEPDGAPGRFTFRILDDPDLRISEGDRVEIRAGEHPIFQGNIFTRRIDNHGVVSVIAYDQIRYLKNRDTVSVSGTASELLRRIAVGHRLEVGRVDDTGVVLPEIVEDNKTLADIIHNALRKTEEMGGGRFSLYDDFGKLTLVPASEMRLDVMLTEDGGTGFLRTVSIDKDTYNNVKLVRDTKNGREFFTASDAGNQAQWGKLQYLAKADEEEDAQAKANSLLNLYNKEQRTLSVTGVHGHPQVRAGCSLMVNDKLSGNPHGNPCVVELAIHRWTGGRWAMDLELKMLRGGNPSGGEARALGFVTWASESALRVIRESMAWDRPNGVDGINNSYSVRGVGLLHVGDMVSVNSGIREQVVNGITWVNITFMLNGQRRTGWIDRTALEGGAANIFVNRDIISDLKWEIPNMPGWKKSLNEIASEINSVLSKYEINTVERIRHFFAQCMKETARGRNIREHDHLLDRDGWDEQRIKTMHEEGSYSYPFEYRGAGYIQLTHKYAYQAFATYLLRERYPEFNIRWGSPHNTGAGTIDTNYKNAVDLARERGYNIKQYTDIVDIGNTYVAMNFACETAGYCWMSQRLNTLVDGLKRNDPNEADKVTAVVNRYDTVASYEQRRNFYSEVMNIIK
jgi:hypothetical protein